jgi:hypothetical protein
LVLLALVAVPAHANPLTLAFLPTNTFSGTAPAGTLTAEFTDVAGGVQLVITSNLAAGENLMAGDALYFNINPALSADLPSLTFTLVTNTGFSQAASVQTGEDAFKPDGDGAMDILFKYLPSTMAFTGGESQTYLITGGPITAADFDFPSTCTTGCGTGSHLAAVHVQNTPSGGSGSAFVGGTLAPVSEPVSSILLGIGLIGVGFTTRRFGQRRG